MNFFNFFKKSDKKEKDLIDKKTLLKDENGIDFDYNSPKSQTDLEVEEILHECNFNPKLILEYVKSFDTPIYISGFSERILEFLGEKEGFITPFLGIKAFWLNLFLKQKISFEFEESFIMKKIPDDIYKVIYEFYKWYSYRKKLPGYDNKTQALFRKIWILEEDENIDKLGYKEILNLKEAITRDMEAINFVERLAYENKKQ